MERIWFDKERRNFYSIPEGTDIPEGILRLRTATGQRRGFDPDALEGYRISKAEATDRIGARLDEAWGGMVGTVDRLLSAGRRATGQPEAEDGRSPLPEHIADWLGMDPGELLTDPDRVRGRLREAAARAGIHIKPRSASDPASSDDSADADARAEGGDAQDAEEVSGGAAEGGGRSGGPDPFREFLRRPEVGELLGGVGRALSQLGSRLQAAGGSPPPREDAASEE